VLRRFFLLEAFCFFGLFFGAVFFCVVCRLCPYLVVLRKKFCVDLIEEEDKEEEEELLLLLLL